MWTHTVYETSTERIANLSQAIYYLTESADNISDPGSSAKKGLYNLIEELVQDIEAEREGMKDGCGKAQQSEEKEDAQAVD